MSRYLILTVLLVAGCKQVWLSDQQLYEQSKRCTDAGMYPIVTRSYVRCVIPNPNNQNYIGQ